MTSAFLVADLGAGSLRTAAVAPDGTILAQSNIRTVSDEPERGWEEADPQSWWRAFCEGLECVLDEVPDLTPEAIAITGMTRSEVFLDADGRSIRPAILWRDRRARQAAVPIARAAGETNPALAVNAFHPLARLAWLAEAEPDAFARLATVLEPKDYLNFRLTGRTASDIVVAGRTERLRGSAHDTIASLTRLLPREMLAPTSVLGTVTAADLPRLAGVPVVVCSMDTWAASVGAGAVAAGRAYDVSGTSEAVGLISAGRAFADGLVSLEWSDDLMQLGGPTQAGADAVRWAYDTFRCEGALAEALERAAYRRPSTDGPMGLVYLLGERAPVWRVDVTGAMVGLTRESGADDALWAVMEGVAHAVRDILTTAESAAGTRAEAVHICGGGGRSDGWCQLRADVLGRPVVRPRELECGLVGAAIAAGVATGRFASLDGGAAAMNPVERVFAPRADRADIFAARAERYARVKAFALAEGDGGWRGPAA